jgi:predicted transposase/invertase (TIGR01784 family)
VAQQDPAIYQAYTIVEELAKNKKEREAYEARQKFLLDQLTRERYAEEEGIKKGIEIGKEEGREEGREEGLIEAAKAMLAEGIAIEMICKITGLDARDFKGE